jgi:hypothetical protein
MRKSQCRSSVSISIARSAEPCFAGALSHNGLRLQNRGRLVKARDWQIEALAILRRIRKPGDYLIERVSCRLANIERMFSA